MLATQDIRFDRSMPSSAGLVAMAIDPVIAVCMLLLATVCFGVPFDRNYVVLSLLVFSMTFPGAPGIESAARAGEANRGVLLHWLLVIALLLLLGWASGTLGVFDQRVIATWLAATPVALLGAHSLVPRILERVLAADRVQRSAVVVGAGETGRRLVERINADPFLGIRFAGYFDDRDPGRLADIETRLLLGNLAQLPDYVKDNNIDVIYIALPMYPQPRLLELLNGFRDTTASVYFVPNILPFEPIQARIDTVGGVPVIAVCESPFYGLNALVKRTSDVFIASLALVVTAPLMLAIAIGVKVTSPGPVLFKQRRNGVDGREIVVYKFRTMSCLEDGDDIVQATRGDSRVTRLGAVLREYSLDELPQLLNVIQGTMSVVGPRPHAVAHNEMYRKVIRGYMIRHKVKPGITGLAQVRGMRGETATVDRMRRRIECDIEYLRTWSLSLDLKVILKTAFVVLTREAAW